RTHGYRERTPSAPGIFRTRTHHRRQRRALRCIPSCPIQRTTATFDGEALVADLPNSTKSHYRILDCGMKSFPIEALSHAPLTAMMKTIKEHQIKADDVKEIKVEVIARAADILGDPHKYRPDSR